MPREYNKINIVIPDDITDEKERKRYYYKEYNKITSERRKEVARIYQQKNKERLREYQNEWYRGKNFRGDVKLLKQQEDMKNRAIDFINQIKKQGGFCGDIQAFQLTNIYSEIFGSTFNRKYEDIESELSYMYLRLKKTIEEGVDFIFTDELQLVGNKTCRNCEVEKDIKEFGKDRKQKDGRRLLCKPCANEYQRKYLENNPDKKEYYKKRNNGK